MWNVYAVKTIYRTKASGTPKSLGKYVRRDIDLIEKQVVTVTARLFEGAAAKGEKEAVKYALASVYLNPNRPKVVRKYIGSIIAFEPYDEVSANIEVFSTTFFGEKYIPGQEIDGRNDWY